MHCNAWQSNALKHNTAHCNELVLHCTAFQSKAMQGSAVERARCDASPPCQSPVLIRLKQLCSKNLRKTLPQVNVHCTPKKFTLYCGLTKRQIQRQRHPDTDKDKYKVLPRPNICYIFHKQGVQGFKILYWLSSCDDTDKDRNPILCIIRGEYFSGLNICQRKNIF